MMASMPHAAICIITDEAIGSKIRGIYKMKGQFTSHLSWICLYVGFHTLGVYIHNDTILAFGQFVFHWGHMNQHEMPISWSGLHGSS